MWTRGRQRQLALKSARRLWHEHSSKWRRDDDVTWVKLDTPIRSGYIRYFIVRPDLARSPEGPLLNRLLILLQNEQSSHRRDFKERDYRKGRKFRDHPHYLRRIDRSEYLILTPAQQRMFQLVATRNKQGQLLTHNLQYEFMWPWKYITKVAPSFITHRAVPNSDIESHHAFTRAQLYGARFAGPAAEKEVYGRVHYDSWGQRHERTPSMGDGDFNDNYDYDSTGVNE